MAVTLKNVANLTSVTPTKASVVFMHGGSVVRNSPFALSRSYRVNMFGSLTRDRARWQSAKLSRRRGSSKALPYNLEGCFPHSKDLMGKAGAGPFWSSLAPARNCWKFPDGRWVIGFDLWESGKMTPQSRRSIYLPLLDIDGNAAKQFSKLTNEQAYDSLELSLRWGLI